MADIPARYHHGDLKAALIAAGRALLEEGGPRAISLRAAARRAGVSHAAPGHHFASLHAFFGDCAADGFDEFARALDDARAGAADPAAALSAMGRAYLRFAAANRAMFRLMFDRDSFSDPTPALDVASTRAYDTLVQAVTALGPATPEELSFRVATIWSLTHGYASLMLEGKLCPDPELQGDPDVMVARALDAFIRGLDAATG
ncbi:TetR/AcrR family transcriptional regulator [Tistrella bauzanensis]|jgi:AcrR family transcriptional regulator|uniref:TetR/AcrR family transcriptional regulator n=1 Tax=Tistrella arctica TaxID=3133430 RepID=A0ABU9YNJ2_9PROT